MAVEVHTWAPNANSGKPPLCLYEEVASSTAPSTCGAAGAVDGTERRS